VTVLGSRGVKQNVLRDLIALQSAVSDEDDRQKLDEAIEKLTDSLNATLWIDQVHLQQRGGQIVFEKEKESVGNLHELMKTKKSSIPDALLQDPINRMVKADRLLAEIAINEARAARGHPEEIADAQRELARGDSAVAAAKFERGVEHYGEAWKKALQAMVNEWR
jgi:hypothetical protein